MTLELVTAEWTDARPYARNARTHQAEQLQRLGDSLQRFGFVVPVLLAPDGEVIAGHGRLAAARALWDAGIEIPGCQCEQFPALTVHGLTPAQIRAYRIADNKLAQLSYFDDDQLAAQLRELSDITAAALGFSEAEMAALTGIATTSSDGTPVYNPDAPPEVVPDAYSLVTFACLVSREQRRAIDAALQATAERCSLESQGAALVHLCRRFLA